MTIRPPHLVWGLVLLLAVVALVRSCGGEERRVRRALDDLGALIERDEGENQLVAADKARRLGDHLTSDFQIRLEPFGATLSNASELRRAFFGYRSGYQQIEVGWLDVDIDVDPDGRRAQIAAVATLAGQRRGGSVRESYRLTFTLRRQDGDWRFHEIVLVEVLEGLERLL